jgi:lysophospholipase L1-like esterase
VIAACAGDGGDASTVGTSVGVTAAMTVSDGESSAEATGATEDASTSLVTTTDPSTTVEPTSTTMTTDPTVDPDDATGGSSGELPPMGLVEVGSLVVLGDSIGDGGGGQPYYYELLRADLDAFYGGIEYVNNAESGSETGALVGQVNDLPDTLPGPVAVVITSGGNDMKDNILAIVAGADGPARAQMQANIDAAHQALLAPNRFGPGVEVHIFEGNMYDASDGVGDYGMNDCAFGGGFPTIPTDPYFESWNGAVAQIVEGNGQIVADMHAHFYGHGYHNPPNWYASDCTHPSTLGHDQLRRQFFELITGEALP